jgi:lipopolysaccharide transport system ATP-binding protein
MAAPAIRVEGLGKRYRLAHGQERAAYRTLRESVMNFVANPFKGRGSVEEFWALSDVSFEVKPGEVVGIIGRNGAGKSTLLKILSRITKPTTGRVEINGRVGSLLEVGTGFHPELTGRENVYLNGSILGMSHSEIAKKFDEIVAFAEVEKFLDTPVKRYSSGMYVRLAFAVAAHLEPEILIVDEVLAVGDVGFQQKCLTKMRECASSGQTVLLVSHQMNSVRDLCKRAIWLDKGVSRGAGPAGAIIERYLAESASHSRPGVWVHLTQTPRARTSRTRIRAARCFGADPNSPPVPNGPFHLSVCLEQTADVSDDLRVEMQILDRLQVRLLVANTIEVPLPLRLHRGITELTFTIDQLHLAPGTYSINLHVGDAENLHDVVNEALTTDIIPLKSSQVLGYRDPSLVARTFSYATRELAFEGESAT